MPGHVFIVRGDLTKLACDAWLLPCDQRLYVSPGWHGSLPPGLRDRLGPDNRLDVSRPAGWSHDGVRTRRLNEWGSSADEPQPWLVNTGGDPETDDEWYLEGIREFVEAAAADGGKPRYDRARPLVGLPLIATGLGGRAEDAGAIVQMLLPELTRLAERHIVDVVLALPRPAAFAAAQHARLQLEATQDCWADLPPRLAAEAGRLGEFAAEGRLVLFLGAGVSAGAGVPTWTQLIDVLALTAKLTAGERKGLSKLDPTDQARLIEARLPSRQADGRRAIGGAVCEVFGSLTHYSLADGLLASLPIGAAATTNYDTLFEAACKGAGRPAAVLPYENPRGRDRWLLKLHGCVTQPDDIVLTREDYLRYADRRGALQGIVQALLVTQHMLFVGFSLTDSNFYAIADDVRKALNPDGGGAGDHRFGTALTLLPDPLRAELWQRDLDLVHIADDAEASHSEAARRLEIFLDRVLAASGVGSQHLLDSDFDDVLTSGERELRDALRRLEAGLSADARRQAAWRPVHALLRELGGP